jgi:hypothetical protein
MELCAHLRWKSLHGAEARTLREVLELAASSQVPFTCLRSCRSWGPDDQLASPELCGSERPCFETSPRFPADRSAPSEIS